jgi:hypothetical protein
MSKPIQLVPGAVSVHSFSLDRPAIVPSNLIEEYRAALLDQRREPCDATF